MPNPDKALLKRLDEDVIGFVRQGIEAGDETRFNDLALRAFESQFRSAAEYRRYCDRRDVSPETVRHWHDIPAVSSFPFRKVLDSTLPAREAEDFYYQSNVADLQRKRGPFFPDQRVLALMNAANSFLEKAYLFPDVEKIRMLFMVPTPRMAPGMVMASGLERIKERFGTEDSRFLIAFKGLDLRGLISELRESEKNGQPLALLGATWGFDYFFDSCRKEGIRFCLPEGSRIVDSGGYVGRYTKCTKEEFFGKCGEVLGISENHCLNALWLCESSTIYFDNVLRNTLACISRERCKVHPPWTRTVVVDPLTFRLMPKGKTGLLRHYDLTNRAMAIAVQTGNMGYETEEGFEVLGKWNQDMNNPDIERQPRHPGGRIVSSVMDRFLAWKFSKIGRLYSLLK